MISTAFNTASKLLLKMLKSSGHRTEPYVSQFDEEQFMSTLE